MSFRKTQKCQQSVGLEFQQTLRQRTYTHGWHVGVDEQNLHEPVIIRPEIRCNSDRPFFSGHDAQRFSRENRVQIGRGGCCNDVKINGDQMRARLRKRIHFWGHGRCC